MVSNRTRKKWLKEKKCPFHNIPYEIEEECGEFGTVLSEYLVCPVDEECLMNVDPDWWLEFESWWYHFKLRIWGIFHNIQERGFKRWGLCVIRFHKYIKIDSNDNKNEKMCQYCGNYVMKG